MTHNLTIPTGYGFGRLLVLMPFGSHLYGTQTANSDYDYKGVFVPTLESALTGRIPKRFTTRPDKAEGQKNAPGDVDIEILSLHEFIRFALEGQTMAIDMLHARTDMLLETSADWGYLVANRSKFYTKNLSAFVGYAKRQAAKYGIKGSRLACAKAWVVMLTAHEDWTVGQLASAILKAGYALDSDLLAHAIVSLPEGEMGSRCAIVALGKQLTTSAKCAHYIPTFESYVKSYGERARMAETNEGVDWKAMSHAIRAAYEVGAIMKFGGFELPFKPHTADELRDIKSGKFGFKEVQTKLERLIEELEWDAPRCGLPETPDLEWAMNFLFTAMLIEGQRSGRT